MAEIEGMARTVGHLLGAAHQRATVLPPAVWTDREVAAIIDHAV